MSIFLPLKNGMMEQQRTRIASSLGFSGPAARRTCSFASCGESRSLRLSRTASMATRRSKGSARNFGSMTGGSLGSAELRVTDPLAA